MRKFELILLDMDGVVADFVTSALVVHGSKFSHDDISKFDMPSLMGLTDDEFWAEIDLLGEEFWTRISPYPWMDELLGLCREFGEEVCYSTSPSKSPYSYSGKTRWLYARFGYGFRDMMIGTHKHHMSRPGTLLVDDSDKNCEKFVEKRKGGRYVTFPQPWNVNRHLCDDRMKYLREGFKRECRITA